ncbi:MAG: class I SAM-dependent methyltransferase [Halioglobus sp.]
MDLEQKKQKNAERIKRLPQGFGIEWTSLRSFQLGGYAFSLPTSFGHFDINVKAEENYSDNVFFLGKTPNVLQRYLTHIRDTRPRKIVELGVFRGGSVAFLQLIAKPERLLALELAEQRQEFLDRFIATEGLHDSVRVEYGVDQADGATVHRLTQEFLGEGRCIDCVIDDASHLLTPTRSSFETLFPLLRPGGTYVVEDFAAAHILISSTFEGVLLGKGPDRPLFNKLLDHSLQSDNQPLHIMAVEALLASIVAPGVVRRVVADRQWLRIERGEEDIDATRPFSLRALAADRFGLTTSVPDPELQNYLQARTESPGS